MEKRGLGRGLAALISDTMSDTESDAHVRDIPLAQIVANPMQPRTLFDPVKLEELTASIKEHGVLQPVLLRRVGHDKFQLLAGERRFRASQQAGLAAIPALVKECTDRQQIEIAIVENLQREDIGAIEAARAYKRMADEFAMTQEAIAARVGKSRAAVANTMGLLDLPEAIQDSIESGQISEGHARALKGMKQDAGMLQMWQAVVRRGLSVRDTEKLVREARTGQSTATQPAMQTSSNNDEESLLNRKPDPNEAYLLNKLQESLKTKVILKRSTPGSGRIEIEFYSPEDLERIVEILVPFA